MLKGKLFVCMLQQSDIHAREHWTNVIVILINTIDHPLRAL